MHVDITELVGFNDGDEGRMRTDLLERVPVDKLEWLYTQSTSELREAVSGGDPAQAARYAIAGLIVANVLHASMDQQHSEGKVSDDAPQAWPSWRSARARHSGLWMCRR